MPKFLKEEMNRSIKEIRETQNNWRKLINTLRKAKKRKQLKEINKLFKT